MGILARFKDIMSANINAMLDKAEDPALMVDEYLRQAMEDFAEVKKETAGVMAQEKQAKRDYDGVLAEVKKYETMARNAVSAGDDEAARRCIEKKQAAEQRLSNVRSTYEVAHANAEHMKQLYKKLDDDIKSLQARRSNVRATTAVAKSQEKVNKFAKGFGSGSRGAEGFARMEQAAQDRLDRASAEAELNEMGLQDDMADLEAKYGAVASSGSVEDELAKLKAQMGQG